MLEIEAIENELNYKFPNDYKEYMNNNNPLKFKNKIIKISNNEKVFGHLLSFDPSSIYFILKWQNYLYECESKFIAIGEFEFGDILCFDKQTNNLVIYFHETGKNEILANNFTNFLSKLNEI